MNQPTPTPAPANNLKRLVHYLWRPFFVFILIVFAVWAGIAYNLPAKAPTTKHGSALEQTTQPAPVADSLQPLDTRPLIENGRGLTDNDFLQRLWELLYVGDQLLLINRDVRGAQLQLKTVSALVERENSSWLMPLRQALDNDLSQLQHYQKGNLASVITQIQWIERSVDNFPLLTERTTSKSDPAKPTLWPDFQKDPQGWLQKLASDIASPFRDLVNIQQVQGADFIAPSQLPYARAQLKLYLLNARLSLLSMQPTLAVEDINQSIKLIERAFNVRNTNVRQTLMTLGDFSKSLQSLPPPPLLTSLVALNALMQNTQNSPSTDTPRTLK